MKSSNFSFISRIKSFGYAFNGLKTIIKYEHNFRIHIVAAILVVIAGLFFEVSNIEWCILTLTIAFVMVTEILNTSIEYICDYLTTDKNYKIGIIKDVAAAAVLLSSIGAVIVGLIIFIPKLLNTLDILCK